MLLDETIGANLSILVVDDDTFIQEVMNESLQQLGFRDIQSAGNGREALRLLDKMTQMPDFLICDLFMPDMDGVEFLEQLGKQHYTGAVIVVSGVNSDVLRIARDIALHDGLRVIGTFLKPLTRHTLALVLAPHRKGH